MPVVLSVSSKRHCHVPSSLSVSLSSVIFLLVACYQTVLVWWHEQTARPVPDSQTNSLAGYALR